MQKVCKEAYNLLLERAHLVRGGLPLAASRRRSPISNRAMRLCPIRKLCGTIIQRLWIYKHTPQPPLSSLLQ